MSKGKERAAIDYLLEITQQPKVTRAETPSRRARAESPIIRVRTRSSPSDQWASPSRTSNLMLFADLVRDDSDVELYLESNSRTQWTCGSSVSSIFHFRDTVDGTISAHFVFPDLRPRKEGAFRYKLSMYELGDNGVDFCAAIFTDPFHVSSRRVELNHSRMSNIELAQRVRPPKRSYGFLDEEEARRHAQASEPSYRPQMPTTAPYSTSALLQYGRSSLGAASTSMYERSRPRPPNALPNYRPASSMHLGAELPASSSLPPARDVSNFYPTLTGPYYDNNRGFIPLNPPMNPNHFEPQLQQQNAYEPVYDREMSYSGDDYGLGRSAGPSVALSRLQHSWSQPARHTPGTPFPSRAGLMENNNDTRSLAPLPLDNGVSAVPRDRVREKGSLFNPDPTSYDRPYADYAGT